MGQRLNAGEALKTERSCHRHIASTRACSTLELERYFCWIGGAIFSAGAGGSTGLAPSFCACASGRAGSGAGVVGRTPPGFDSAGLSSVVVEGVPCVGGVACAT